MNRPAAGRERRDPGLDVFRGAAVLLMFVVHSRRLQPSGPFPGLQGLAGAALDALLWAEPFIAASFLTIAGTSLVHAHHRSRDPARWIRRLGWRAGGLYLLAIALFIPQFGVVFPDLLASPGILSAIAVALWLTGLALTRSRPACWLVALWGLTGLGALGLETTGRCLPGLNAGPGGAVPLLGFTALGALLGLVQVRFGRRALGVATVVATAGALAVVGAALPFTTRCVSLYPAHDGLLALGELLGQQSPGQQSPGQREVVFWNHSAAGLLGLSAPIVATLFGLSLLPWSTSGSPRSGGVLALIGRHALVVYVGHLILLGILELSGVTPRAPLSTWTLVGALAFAAAITGAGLETRGQRWDPLRRRKRSGLPAPARSVVASSAADPTEEIP